MCYKCLREFLIDQGFKNDEVCSFYFIKRTDIKLVIVAIYVKDLYTISTTGAIFEIVFKLKGQFKMKDLDETTFCLGLQVEKLAESIFLHQSLYTQNSLNCFSMDVAYPLRSLMVVRSSDLKKNGFRLYDEGKKYLRLETPYLATTCALMYLAN